jgi:multidrug efflux pump subunit AcrB
MHTEPRVDAAWSLERGGSVSIGWQRKYVEVNLNYRAMQARGLTPSDVISAVNAQNLIPQPASLTNL